MTMGLTMPPSLVYGPNEEAASGRMVMRVSMPDGWSPEASWATCDTREAMSWVDEDVGGRFRPLPANRAFKDLVAPSLSHLHAEIASLRGAPPDMPRLGRLVLATSWFWTRSDAKLAATFRRRGKAGGDHLFETVVVPGISCVGAFIDPETSRRTLH